MRYPISRTHVDCAHGTNYHDPRTRFARTSRACVNVTSSTAFSMSFISMPVSLTILQRATSPLSYCHNIRCTWQHKDLECRLWTIHRVAAVAVGLALHVVMAYIYIARRL